LGVQKWDQHVQSSNKPNISVIEQTCQHMRQQAKQEAYLVLQEITDAMQEIGAYDGIEERMT